MNPIANNIGVLNLILPPYIVASHENIFIPVGTAIINVADVKYALVSTSSPTVYMWCTGVETLVGYIFIFYLSLSPIFFVTLVIKLISLLGNAFLFH